MKKAKYVWINLSAGSSADSYPVHYTDDAPDTKDDECRTRQLWLRRIPAGTFLMGSQRDEVGRYDDEDLHPVTLTKDFYIGVFPCTQRQWELVMGTKPSYFTNAAYYATQPVEQVSYDDIRGSSPQAGAGWPACGHTVDAASFMGKLQTRTELLFDLPTEAQWEYACRKKADGSCWDTALNSGDDLTALTQCANMDDVGRYWNNGGSGYSSSCDSSKGTAKVGSYQPSELGLYDMHGNVCEWCLDWYVPSLYTAAAEDPVGVVLGSYRVLRGGGWNSYARDCRAAVRHEGGVSHRDCNRGFRVALHLDDRDFRRRNAAAATAAPGTCDMPSLSKSLETAVCDAVKAAIDVRLAEIMADISRCLRNGGQA